jgi:hypothetical protein
MALEKLQIIKEKKGANLDFDRNEPIVALFNPNKLVISKSVAWPDQNAAQRDTPEAQFVHGNPSTLRVELFFDTYDTPDAVKENVTKYTQKLFHLTTVEEHGHWHRPPICRLLWGSFSQIFQGVLESLEQQFTLFMEDGLPVRATVTCNFKEWRQPEDDERHRDAQSADLAKFRVLKSGESLSHIAGEEYSDPGAWRAIAEANQIDDPLSLVPGRSLAVPRLRPK